MIGIIDYGVGNLGSVQNAFLSVGVATVISNEIKILEQTNGLVLPGDGAAKEGMKNLKKLKLDAFIAKEIKRKKPFLGICLGMQLLMETSEEGNVSCLGLLKGFVKKIKTQQKLPQIGWNTVRVVAGSNILKKTQEENFAYFIHSYVCVPKENITFGKTTYGENFCSVFEKENIFGTQFHPEKSGEFGRQILKNFMQIC